MKKIVTGLLAAVLLAGCSSPANETEKVSSDSKDEVETTVKELPAPVDTSLTYKPSEDAEETECTTNSYVSGCAAINNTNLRDYLNRDDVLYIDLRDYSDYAKKHLRNFECIPYFALIYSKEGGKDIPQLYSGDLSNPTATYEESDELLEAFFPKDQTIFLMCQSGGRVAQLMQILEAKGYDMSRIYNITGMGQYSEGSYLDLTEDTAEVNVEANYSFEGLTRIN